jgi:hypothetical protein
MKKWAGVFVGLLLFPFVLFAQETGNEIPNQVDAIVSAQPGDYILLPSGNKYVLTKEEIMIANGTFGYENFSDIPSVTKADGTVIKTISQAHEINIYPDGKTVHVLKTRAAFAYSLRYIEENYYPMRYLDSSGVLHDSRPIDPPNFYVFRVFIQSEIVSNGVNTMEVLVINAYNYEGNNFTTKYCSAPDMVWGQVSSQELYKTVVRSINEKWEITSPGGAYSFFEFNMDRNYIAVENTGRVHFGGYIMPEEDTINMENLGVLKINEDKDGINLLFTPIGKEEMDLIASRIQKLPESAELDLFCRSWKVKNISYDVSDNGTIIIFSNVGTYLVYEIDGSVRLLSRWRWHNDNHAEWEYSHDNGLTWGDVRIMELKENYLKMADNLGTVELVLASN